MIWLVVALVLAAVVLAAIAWGWFEAGWLRRRVLEVELEGLPPALDGVRIAHLSDFHLGVRSRGTHATEQAVRWVAERRPDLVCVTGDLVSRRKGLPEARRLLRALAPCFVVLGNHDFAISRDPFSQPVDPAEIASGDGVRLLGDEAVEVELQACRVQMVGVDPRTYATREARPERLVDADADLRVLLCHFPVARWIAPDVFDVVLSGHLHAGQIVLPLPRRKLAFAHPRARPLEGVYRHGSTVLHVSPGLGTTFVPFRFFARPEVTELVVRSPR